MDSELLIKISADAKNATKAFDDVKEHTEDLKDWIKDIGEVSAVAFGVLVGELYLSVDAFHEADKASRDLANTLQNVGLYSDALKDSYTQYAEEVSKVTGIETARITAAQATSQAALGQVKITKELTQAIADYAAGTKSDLQTAAVEVSRAIGTGTGAFIRYDHAITGLATTQERYAEVLQFVNTKYKDSAQIANEAAGGAVNLKTQFVELQEQIGQRLAPAVAFANKVIAEMLNYFRQSPAILDTAVAIGVVVAGITGIIAASAAVGVAALAWSALSAAAAAVGVALLPVIGIVSAIVAGIGVLIFTMSKFGVTWSDVWTKAHAVISFYIAAWTTLIKDWSSVMAALFKSIVTGSIEPLKKAFADLQNPMKEGIAAFKKTNAEIVSETKKTENEQNEIKKQAADKAEAQRRQLEASRVSLQHAQNELIILELNNASNAAIAIKKKEIETLTQMTNTHKQNEVALLRQKMAELKVLEDEQNRNDEQRKKVFAEVQANTDKQINRQHIASRIALNKEEARQIQQTLETESTTDQKIRAEILKRQIQVHNQMLLDTKKYGAAVATLNQILASEEVQGAKSVAGELVGMAQSKNATLKAIGQSAAVAQIVIGTAESVSTLAQQIPRIVPWPFNIPVIAAAVGARIAFGAEQISAVQGAAEGGLVQGGTPGKDSVPFMLTPGELVVPPRSFDDVVGAYQGKNNDSNNDAVVSQLQDISKKLERPYTVIQGDVLADEHFIDTLIRKIDDRLQFSNGRFAAIAGS